MISHNWNPKKKKKRVQINLSTKQKQIYRFRKQTDGYQGVKGGGGMNQGDLD